jgi:hypothetical protein
VTARTTLSAKEFLAATDFSNSLKSEARLLTMFAGWLMAFCGVRRRSWPGTLMALAGLGLAQGVITIGKGEMP